MVAPVRDLGNKFSFTTINISLMLTFDINLPTMELRNTTGMDIFKGQNPNNYDDVRGREPSQSPNSSRDASMVSSTSSIPYHEKMEKNNKMDIDNNGNSSPELFYETIQEKKL